MLDRSLNGFKVDDTEMMRISWKINDIILSYGSTISINILKEYFKICNCIFDGNTKKNLECELLLRLLLFSQVKFEVSGTSTKPNEYLYIRYFNKRDEEKDRDIINSYIEKFKMDKSFKV